MDLLRTLAHKQFDADETQKIKSKTSTSDTFKQGDINVEPTTDHERKICDTINQLNELIYELETTRDDTNPDNDALLIQATNLRDELKQELSKSLPDSQLSTLPGGSNLQPGIFHKIG